MTSEWLKVMLEEIARKKAETEQAQAEELRRRGVVPDGRPVQSVQCAPGKKKDGDVE